MKNVYYLNHEGIYNLDKLILDYLILQEI